MNSGFGRTLPVIALLMTLSAILRIGAGTQIVMAETSGTPDSVANVEQADKNMNEGFYEELVKRSEALERKEKRFLEKQKAFLTIESEIEKKLIELSAAEAALSATISQAENASQTDISNLATVYQNMKPKDAAALFAQMPSNFAAGFIGMMDPVSAAAIMAALPPEKAYSFSVFLAGRNAGLPAE